MNAGITLLKKNSAIDTSKKHAITYARVLLTCKYSVINVIPTKHPIANNIRTQNETYQEQLEFRCLGRLLSASKPTISSCLIARIVDN